MARAFTAGINAYVDFLQAHPERMPFEFKTLGYAPAKWQPEDVVRIRSHGLTRNLNSEVARAAVACSPARCSSSTPRTAASSPTPR